MSGVTLLLSDARGVYIPRDFAEMASEWEGIGDEDIDTLLAGPDHEWYWEAWDDVCSNATYIDKSGNKWMLYQNGDLWAYCEELMTWEEKKNWDWDIEGKLEEIFYRVEPEIRIVQLGAFDKWYFVDGEGQGGPYNSWLDAAVAAADFYDLVEDPSDKQTLPLFDTSEERA